MKTTKIGILLGVMASTIVWGDIADPIPAKIPKGPLAIELQTVASGLTAPVYIGPPYVTQGT